jgi:hypothetical protein
VHQFRQRIVGRPALQENDLHAEPFQFIQDQGLQHKLARQPIGAVGQQHLEPATLRQIPHPVQRRPIQPRPAVPVVGKFLDDVHTVFHRIGAQGLDL